MAGKVLWEVEPWVSAGPLHAGITLADAIAELAEEPRLFPPTQDCRATFEGWRLQLSVQNDHVQSVSFLRHDSVVIPTYRGIRLLGNWKVARDQLKALGVDTPEPARNDEPGHAP